MLFQKQKETESNVLYWVIKVYATRLVRKVEADERKPWFTVFHWLAFIHNEVY